MSIGTKPQTYMRSYKTPSVAYFSRDTIIKASLHLFMFVYGELKKTIYISLEVMEFTPPAPPPNKAYLSLYKLVPVVIRKRSIKLISFSRVPRWHSSPVTAPSLKASP